jgi:hypothetical protein
MVSYKQQLFISLIDDITLNESYSYNGKISLLELLLEVAMDDSMAKKLIDTKKRNSIYYQGDDKIKKGWHAIEPIRLATKEDGAKYLYGYDVPKDGSKPELQYFKLDKIVNWNILGNKNADLAKEYNEKIQKFFDNPKIPVERKEKYKEKLQKLGIKVKNFFKKAAVGTAMVGSLMMPFKSDIKTFLRKQYPNVAELYSTRNLSTSDFKDSQIKAIGTVIHNAIQRNHKKNKGSTEYVDYPEEVSKFVTHKEYDKLDYVMKQVGSNPYLMVGTTLGRFKYTLQKDGSYLVTDIYDFSKSPKIKTTKDDVKDLIYPLALRKIMKDNNVGYYKAIRHMAYLEHPDSAPDSSKSHIAIIVPGSYVTGTEGGGVS